MPVAYPRRIVFTTNKCDYCDKEYNQLIMSLNSLTGIKCCNSHLGWGERDVKAWYHTMELIPVEEVLDRYNLPRKGLVVPRADGSTSDGYIIESTHYDTKFVRKDLGSGSWFLDVGFIGALGNTLQKSLELKNLVLSGVEVAQIDAIISDLEDGLFKNEYGLSLLENCEDPLNMDKELEGLRMVYVDGVGIGQILDMPVQCSNP